MASAQTLPLPPPASSKKQQDHISAGRRRLEEFKKKKAEEKREAEKKKKNEQPVHEARAHSSSLQGTSASTVSNSLLPPPVTPNEPILSSTFLTTHERPSIHETNGDLILPPSFSETSPEIGESIAKTKPTEHPWRNPGLSEQYVRDSTEKEKLSVQQDPDVARSSTDHSAQENTSSFTGNFFHQLEEYMKEKTEEKRNGDEKPQNKHAVEVLTSSSSLAQDVQAPADQFSSKSLLSPFTEAAVFSNSTSLPSNVSRTSGSLWSRPNQFLIPSKPAPFSAITVNDTQASYERSPSKSSTPPIATSNGHSDSAFSTFEISSVQKASAKPSPPFTSPASPRASPKFDGSVRKEKPVEQPWQNSRLSERDEFASLEQYIQDLTEEKFSLQRALDAARSLTATLAQENSSLTENFNQQGALINQLKTEMERQQEELQSQMVTLNKFMTEREKNQQEKNSAVERSQILAKEVITLEEKVLKMRSNELKLERAAEKAQNDIDSFKRQMSSMEKDRENLRSMVEALNEEKKLLQDKVRKGAVVAAPVSSKEITIPKDQKDAATSTDDLGGSTGSLESTSQNSSPLSTDLSLNIAAISGTTTSFLSSGLPRNSILSGSAVSVPPDQMRMVDNINNLIAELAEEKAKLTQTLRNEASEVIQLRALNTDLSQKLEMQTQRLELVIAQNMAHGGAPMIMQNEPRDDVEFVDEGDEVVDRVLGWIMKLFPGGSSKRRTSKLL